MASGDKGAGEATEVAAIRCLGTEPNRTKGAARGRGLDVVNLRQPLGVSVPFWDLPGSIFSDTLKSRDLLLC